MAYKSFKHNVINSFNKVKSDMGNLWSNMQSLYDRIIAVENKVTDNSPEIQNIKLAQMDIENRLVRLEESQNNIIESVSALLGIKEHKFVLNKSNRKLHTNDCGFAHRIKPEHAIFYDSIDDIHSKFIRCACVKN